MYAAAGVNSGKRGLYYAAPVYQRPSTDTPAAGVMVMKMGVATINAVLPPVSMPDTDRENAPLVPELAARVAGQVREAAGLGDVGAIQTLAESLPPNSRQVDELKCLAAGFDLDGLSRFADELEGKH